MVTQDKVLGCILAGAVADAIGYQVEFDKLPAILRKHGKDGVSGPLAGHALVASDDTQMALFFMESLTCREHARPHFLDWYATQNGKAPGRAHGWLHGQRVMHQRQAPGNTCLTALSTGGRGTLEEPINNSKGCGGVMRAAPCGLLPNISADDAFRVGCHQAAITHGHVEGWASAGALSRIVWGMARGEPLWQAASEAADCANMVQGYLTENLIRHVIAIAHGPLLTPQEIVGELGEGWVGEEALAVGLYAALVGKNYRHALRIAITHDGDSDSTGSIAGNILGARDGAAIVPTAWIGMLDLAHVCRQTAFRFCEEYNIV